ncbi:hypothetical protein [Gloeocapsopsis sp. IPPAS B-1203]|uniref:hypothetical protein n=1 Tax=Gloeocapsopsis sp. IPPAS B-1203 TaxID=2049454 RepID=UPI000C1A6162|nr:hypothetical protein [Gloeocapsopsis sp. IPPAS B-1203]PIG92465.1 hypothetical protein CSQ79_15350 [Gloeocapsopsis sp. IPPAS B-1203]
MKASGFTNIYLQKKQNTKSLFRIILLRLFQALTSRDRLQVWQKKDRYGRSYWQAYDPVSDSKISLASEAEMRVWIEQRYYK